MPSLLSLFAVALTTAITSASLEAASPAWWIQRGVTNPAATKNDFAAANIGQLKNIAKKAADELNEWLPHGGAGEEINALIYSWRPQEGVVRNDFAAVNHGQVKAVGKRFYDRLAAQGYQGRPLTEGAKYPWTTTKDDDASFNAASVGQVKFVFSFDVMPDSDGDGMPDAWETLYGLNPNNNADASPTADADGDGMSNKDEYLMRRNPNDKSDKSGAVLADFDLVIRLPGTSENKFYGLEASTGSLTEVQLPASQ